MTDRPITWADLTLSGAEAHARPANNYSLTPGQALTGCPKCAHVVARRLPTGVSAADDGSAEAGTYHRNLADARAGAAIITACAKCGAPLARRNPAN